MSDDSYESKKSQELVEAGSDLASALAGASVGLMGGPIGATLGAVTGVGVAWVLKKVGAELQGRKLAPREHKRIGAAFVFACEAIRERLEAGELPRDDGFFEEHIDGRSEADELLEGVLLYAGSEYQERKLPYTARLYSSLVFCKGIDAAYGYFLLQLTGQLTYGQLVCIAAFSNDLYIEERERLQVAKAEGDIRSVPAGPVAELEALNEQALIGVRQSDGSVKRTINMLGGWSGFDIGLLALTSRGQALYDLMGLKEIPKDEITELFLSLHGKA